MLQKDNCLCGVYATASEIFKTLFCFYLRHAAAYQKRYKIKARLRARVYKLLWKRVWGIYHVISEKRTNDVDRRIMGSVGQGWNNWLPHLGCFINELIKFVEGRFTLIARLKLMNVLDDTWEKRRGKIFSEMAFVF